MDPSYNNPLGGSQYPISSGDVVLNVDGVQKNPKKKLAIISFMIIILGIVIGLVFLFNNHSGNTVNNYKNSFNKYANYLLFGNDDIQNIDEIDTHDFYYIDENYSNSDYVQELKNKYSTFLELIPDENEELNMVASINSPMDELNFFSHCNEIQYIDIEYIRNMYNQTSYDDTITYLYNEYGSRLDDSTTSESDDEEVENVDNDNEKNEDIDDNYLIRKIKEYDYNKALSLVKEWNGNENEQEFIPSELYKNSVISSARVYLKEKMLDVGFFLEVVNE